MANSCILTGGSGFIGRNLIAYLKDRSNPVHALERIELQSACPGHLTSFHTVVHLAGIAHDLKKGSTEDDYFQINYGLTKSLFDAFLLSDAKKFIFVSSVKAVADDVSGILTEEQVPLPETA